ncbi:MAG: hypothetical protein AAGJ95_15810 [Cyanobacteria bacterium J06554_11]
MGHRSSQTVAKQKTIGKQIGQLIGATGLILVASFFTSAPQLVPTRAVAQAGVTQRPQVKQQSMTLDNLEAILQDSSNTVEGSNGQWQVSIEGRTLLVLADATNNRMRIFTPITSTGELSAPQIQAVLLANFHTTLDARYALSQDTLVSTFVHPLDSLEENFLRSALLQVATLANNFGSTYSSGALDFGPAGQSNRPSSNRIPRGDRLEI